MIALFLSAATPSTQTTLIDYYKQTGTGGAVAVFVFIAGVLLALLLLITRSGLARRAAFVPYAFIPLVVGISSFAAAMGNLGRYGSGFDLADTLAHFGELSSIISFTGVLTGILLAAATLLLLTAPQRR